MWVLATHCKLYAGVDIAAVIRDIMLPSHVQSLASYRAPSGAATHPTAPDMAKDEDTLVMLTTTTDEHPAFAQVMRIVTHTISDKQTAGGRRGGESRRATITRTFHQEVGMSRKLWEAPFRCAQGCESQRVLMLDARSWATSVRGFSNFLTCAGLEHRSSGVLLRVLQVAAPHVRQPRQGGRPLVRGAGRDSERGGGAQDA
jgi:hypothetical protein